MDKKAQKRELTQRLRDAVRKHTGLSAHQYGKLPRAIKKAVRSYIAEVSEPKSPTGGMYDHIRDQFGFEWQKED